jgi:hypothetical protein
MIQAWNYIADVRNRLLALIHYRRNLNNFVSINNVAKVHDADYVPLLSGKPSARTAGDFPQIDVAYGDGTDPLLANIQTIGLEPEDTVELYNDFAVVMTFEGRQYDANAQTELEVMSALRAGGRQLALPSLPDSALDYVVRWGDARIRRQPRKAYKAVRMESRAVIRVYMEIMGSEFNFDV